MLKKMSLFLLLVCSLPAQAALHLELTQGVNAAIPVALVPFEGAAKAPVNVSEVISTDLKHSGRFALLPNKYFLQHPHAADEVNFSYWRKAGADDVIVGRVTSAGTQHYKVEIALLSVYKNKQSPQSNDSGVVFSKSFTIKSDRLRALAHHLSDLVYKQLTGDRGVFSTRIAYVLVDREPGKSIQYRLMVADADGENAQPILMSKQPIMSPTWSPDGKQVAYVSFEKDVAQIYVSNVVTGDRHLITSFPGINGAPAWSPDGKHLALVLSKASGKPKIYTLDLADNSVKQMTKGAAIDTEPTWAPDGQSIAFTSNRGGGPQIYRLDIHSGDVQRMTFEGNYNARAHFSPDGQSLVFLHREDGLFNIAVQQLKTGALKNLTQTGRNKSPSIAPNGKMALYASNVGGRGVLGIVSLDGRIKLRLPSQSGDVQEPAWSPFLN